MTDFLNATEEKLLNELSVSERKVYEYIKDESIHHNGRIKISMKDIGIILSTSEATVNRAIMKLRKYGIVAIEPSTEKAESNEIVYFGFMEPDQQVSNIVQLISSLSANTNRFKAILESKDQEINELKSTIEQLYQKIDSLESALKDKSLLKDGFENLNIISKQDLGGGKIAYLIQT